VIAVPVWPLAISISRHRPEFAWRTARPQGMTPMIPLRVGSESWLAQAVVHARETMDDLVTGIGCLADQARIVRPFFRTWDRAQRDSSSVPSSPGRFRGPRRGHKTSIHRSVEPARDCSRESFGHVLEVPRFSRIPCDVSASRVQPQGLWPLASREPGPSPYEDREVVSKLSELTTDVKIWDPRPPPAGTCTAVPCTAIASAPGVKPGRGEFRAD